MENGVNNFNGMDVSHKLEDLHDLHEDLLVMLKLINSTNKRQSSV